MTVQGELNGDAQSLEYIACVEGLGWPSNAADLTAAWQGTVIASADQAATLATVLGCTVVGGLTPPSSYADSIDPVTMEFTSGAVDFDVTNVASWLDDVITPRKDTEQSGAEGAGTLMVDLLYGVTTVDIEWANPGGTTDPFEEGDVAWVGGREAILLGARAVEGAGYRYTSCTRGYLGTPHGTWDPRGSWEGARAFRIGTTCYPFNPFWRGRRVMIFAHVPGEARGNCVRLFQGRLTNLVRQGHGTVWRFSATAGTFVGHRRVVERANYMSPVGGWRATSDELYPLGYCGLAWLQDAEGAPSDGLQEYAAYYLYRYRSVPGGAELPSVTETSPQAEIGTIEDPESGEQVGSTDMKLAQTLVRIGKVFWRLVGQAYAEAGLTEFGVRWFHTRIEPGFSQELGTPHEPSPVTVLLDNIIPEAGPNRFTVNETVRLNVIDVALIWMTSCDSEFFRADAAAAGTTTTVNFTAPGWTTDQWEGYALHCVEGDNKGEARVISGNDADTITVDSAFSAATHEGNEYQIRNSIYDVLPWGWGLQIHNADIDVGAWEDLRDRYLADAEVGRFAVGTEPDIDYWELIVENLFKPYGVMPYVDRSTGKLKPRFIFSLTTDASFETLTSVTDADLLDGSFESIDLMPRAPVTRIRIVTRKSHVVPYVNRRGKSVLGERGALTVGGEDGGHVVELRAGDAELQYDASERDTLEITAMLNDKENLSQLSAMHVARLRDLVKPCYETTIYLHNRLMLIAQAGALLSITSTAFGVRDPFSNAAGLSSCPARILSSAAKVEPGGQTMVECRIQLLDPVESSRIAPACDTTAYSDEWGDGIRTIKVTFNKYVDEPVAYTCTDYMHFRAGDLVEIRDKYGALKEGPLTIEYFGNGFSDPLDADDHWITVLEEIASVFAAGDYLTFSAWANTATANMELHSALADATDEELGAGDSPKEYL